MSVPRLSETFYASADQFAQQPVQQPSASLDQQATKVIGNCGAELKEPIEPSHHPRTSPNQGIKSTRFEKTASRNPISPTVPLPTNDRVLQTQKIGQSHSQQLRTRKQQETTMSTNGVFLSLAPATSASYPRAPVSRPQVPGQEAPVSHRRTSSSASSTSASTTRHRILKLGPVHWGEHQDDHKEDFHEPTAVV
ncbi:hypothetical protein E4U14_003552 [Claviceps sp. LM454 group G7]|nr:hypothetical protein E4U14_003552 [Claviceps sp. LM454 group G7]